MHPRRGKSSDETASSGNTASTQQTRTTDMTTPLIDDVLPDLQPPSDREAQRFYSRLPSCPRLVGRTPGRQLWKPVFSNNVVLPRSEEVTTIGNQHEIVSLWDEGLMPGVLKAVKTLPWTSIDVVRIGLKSEKRSLKPVVVWIGVSTADIPWPQTAQVLRTCRALLDTHNLRDVEVEIRVSSVFSTAGPALFPAGIDIVDMVGRYRRAAYSTAVSQSFASARAPYMRGTLGLYLWTSRTEDSGLFALTCRHVALPDVKFPGNRPYRRRLASQPVDAMVIPADKDINDWISDANDAVNTWQDHVHAARQDKTTTAETMRVQEDHLRSAMKLKLMFESLNTIEARIVGDVFFSPPIGTAHDGPFPWMRDWSLVRLNKSKFPGGRMPENVVDLRSNKWIPRELTELLNPHPRSKHKFTYPKDGILQLSGVIPVKEMHTPNMIDGHGEECVLVGKRGAATGLTFGAANEILSVIRHVDGVEELHSREWLVASFDKNVVFSAGGDSGSVIFDIYGRVGGLLTGGSRMSLSTNDITYVTPMELILDDIKKQTGSEVKMV